MVLCQKATDAFVYTQSLEARSRFFAGMVPASFLSAVFSGLVLLNTSSAWHVWAQLLFCLSIAFLALFGFFLRGVRALEARELYLSYLVLLKTDSELRESLGAYESNTPSIAPNLQSDSVRDSLSPMSTSTYTRVESDKQLLFLRVHICEKPYWEYVTRTNSAQGVTIVALTDQQEIILVAQHRIPLNATVIELPAGLVGDKSDKETPEEAVARELREETGYVVAPNNIRLLARGPALAGLTDEVNGLFLATDVKKAEDGGGVQGEGEDIATLVVPLATVMEKLGECEKDGRLIDLRVFAGLYFLR